MSIKVAKLVLMSDTWDGAAVKRVWNLKLSQDLVYYQEEKEDLLKGSYTRCEPTLRIQLYLT